MMTIDAEEDLDRFIRYLLFEKQNSQAASNVLNDFEATKKTLSNVAGSLKLCDNPRLMRSGTGKFISCPFDTLCCTGLMETLP